MDSGIKPPSWREKFHWWSWRRLRRLRAPVVPYTWVIEKVKATGKPVNWTNPHHSGWVMQYRSKLKNGEVITRLRTRSYKPTEGWLQKD